MYLLCTWICVLYICRVWCKCTIHYTPKYIKTLETTNQMFVVMAQWWILYGVGYNRSWTYRLNHLSSVFFCWEPFVTGEFFTCYKWLPTLWRFLQYEVLCRRGISSDSSMVIVRFGWGQRVFITWKDHLQEHVQLHTVTFIIGEIGLVALSILCVLFSGQKYRMWVYVYLSYSLTADKLYMCNI